jgi:hypothetical protein
MHCCHLKVSEKSAHTSALAGQFARNAKIPEDHQWSMQALIFILLPYSSAIICIKNANTSTYHGGKNGSYPKIQT